MDPLTRHEREEIEKVIESLEGDLQEVRDGLTEADVERARSAATKAFEGTAQLRGMVPGQPARFTVVPLSRLQSQEAQEVVADALCRTAGGDSDLRSLFEDKAEAVTNALAEAMGGSK